MRVLFVGLGSIGQRHLRNLKRLVTDEVEIFACRRTRHNLCIEDGRARQVDSLADHLGFTEMRDLHEALDARPQLVFVTNPSGDHIETAIEAARRGCHLFIEKPLADSLADVDELRRLVAERNLTVMVGYQTRFHPCYQLTRDILRTGEYGPVLSAAFEWGTYLPSHHPYEDYREGYAARRDRGGGVLLGLIHEPDMIQSFWGQPERIAAVGGKLSTLEMDVEDTVAALMTYDDDGRQFPVTLSLSYAQTREVRRFRIQFDRATLLCDLCENTLSLFDRHGECARRENFPQSHRKQLFVDEMSEFLSAVRERRTPSVSLDDGIESLRIVERIKQQLCEPSHAAV